MPQVSVQPERRFFSCEAAQVSWLEWSLGRVDESPQDDQLAIVRTISVFWTTSYELAALRPDPVSRSDPG